jgi:hypothetical protein
MNILLKYGNIAYVTLINIKKQIYCYFKNRIIIIDNIDLLH